MTKEQMIRRLQNAIIQIIQLDSIEEIGFQVDEGGYTEPMSIQDFYIDVSGDEGYMHISIDVTKV